MSNSDAIVPRLWRGEVSLFQTFWLYRILGTLIILYVSEFLIGWGKGSGDRFELQAIELFICAFSIAYTILITVALWRSADVYGKGSGWREAIANLAIGYAVLSCLTSLLLNVGFILKVINPQLDASARTVNSMPSLAKYNIQVPRRLNDQMTITRA